MNIKLLGNVAVWAGEFLLAAIVIYSIMYAVFKLKYFKNKYVWMEGLAVDDWIVDEDLEKEMIQRKKCEKFARWFGITSLMHSNLSSLESEGLVESGQVRNMFAILTANRKYRLTPTGRLKKKFQLNRH